MEDNKTQSQPLKEALKQPNGARFYRCALQVNPFAYHGRHAKQTVFQTEAEYNAAIVSACKENNIEAIAITDHYRVADSWSLINEVRTNGIFVFGGFEASTKDGVHFLCLYDPDKDQNLERLVGQFAVHDHNALSPNGDKDCLDLLACVRKRGGIAIAAHVAADNGLLVTLDDGVRGRCHADVLPDGRGAGGPQRLSGEAPARFPEVPEVPVIGSPQRRRERRESQR